MPHLRPIACERCSRRKQRCDRVLPTCSNCRKSSSECREAARERMMVRVSGHDVRRKGYIRLLEERIAQLEQQARLQRLLPEQDDPLVQDGCSSSEISPPRVSSPPAPDEVNLNNLALYAMAEPRRRQDEFLRELSMPRIISVVAETYGGNPEATERVHPLWDAVAKYVRTGDATTTAAKAVQRIYFPAAVAEEALDTYRRMVDYRYPRLAAWKAEHGLEALTAEDDTLHQAMLQAHPAHLFIAYMVIAIVPLVSDQYPVSQGSFISAHILSTSLKVLDAVFRKEDGIDIVQCLNMLVVFSMHSSAAGSSWHLIGFAMEKCIALGYHKESSVMTVDAEERRWVFWGSYLLDRLISNALDRPFSINDRDISVQLPQEVGSIEDSRHVHLFRYAMLLSEVMDDGGRSPVTVQLSGLLHWRSLNPHADDAASSPLHQTHFASLDNTLMLRLAVGEIIRAHAAGTAPGGMLHRAAHASISPVLHIPEICKAVVNSLNRPDMRQRSFLSWMTGYSAFSVALVIIYCSPIWTDETRPETLLETVKEILDLLAKQFSRLRQYAQIINSLQKAEPVSDEEIMKIGPRHLQTLGRLIVRQLPV